MYRQLPPEDRLCLLLSQAYLRSDSRQQVLALTAAEVNWRAVLETLKAHEVYPAAWKNLQVLQLDTIPAEVRADLDMLYRVNALRNSLLAAELTEILREFESRSIPVIPLKGLFLAEHLYGGIDARVCTDLDILVPPDQVQAAYDALVSRGYRAGVPRWVFSGTIIRSSFEATFLRNDRSMLYPVELHWGVMWENSSGDGSAGYFWRESGTQEFLRSSVQVLSEECQLAFLAVHLARHQWQGLKWLVDIHEICEQKNLDWERTLQIADRLGWRDLVSKVLHISHCLLGTHLPAQIPRRPSLCAQVTFPAHSRPASALRNTLLSIQLTDSPAGKLELFLRRLLAPTLSDTAWCRLPESMGFFYYFVRPARLAWLAMKAPLRWIAS